MGLLQDHKKKIQNETNLHKQKKRVVNICWSQNDTQMSHK